MPFLVPLTVAGCSRAMAAGKERSLHLSQTLGDRYVLDGSLDAGGGSVVAAALRLAPSDDGDAARTPATRRADALVEVCRFFLDHQQSQSGGRHRPHVNVVLDLEAFEAGGGGRGWADRASTRRRSRACCAAAPCTGCYGRPLGRPRLRPVDAHHPRPLWNALVIRDEHSASPAATGRRGGATAITSCGSPTADHAKLRAEDGHRDRSLWPRMFDVPAASLARVARSAPGATRPCGD